MTRSPRRPRLARRLVVAGAIAAVPALLVAPAWAWWSDTDALNATVTAGTVKAQAQPTCTTSGGLGGVATTAVLTFTKNQAGVQYAWRLVDSGGTTRSSGTVGATDALNATETITISGGLVNLNGSFTVVVQAQWPADTAWVAPTTTSTPVVIQGLIVLPAARCA
jgi:predicted ribosomally synthesized peptide with SipW-like signal peptide